MAEQVSDQVFMPVAPGKMCVDNEDEPSHKRLRGMGQLARSGWIFRNCLCSRIPIRQAGAARDAGRSAGAARGGGEQPGDGGAEGVRGDGQESEEESEKAEAAAPVGEEQSGEEQAGEGLKVLEDQETQICAAALQRENDSQEKSHEAKGGLCPGPLRPGCRERAATGQKRKAYDSVSLDSDVADARAALTEANSALAAAKAAANELKTGNSLGSSQGRRDASKSNS